MRPEMKLTSKVGAEKTGSQEQPLVRASQEPMQREDHEWLRESVSMIYKLHRNKTLLA